MWTLYHHAAPNGRMEMPDSFKTYIEEILPKEGELHHFGVKIDPEDPRLSASYEQLFRGYSMG
eukprot:gene51977-48147_t